MVQACPLKDLLSRAQSGLSVQRGKTICAILIEGISGNTNVKLFLIWTSGSGGDVVKRHLLCRALKSFLFSGAVPFVQFW